MKFIEIDGVLFNVANICKVVRHTNGTSRVYTADGSFMTIFKTYEAVMSRIVGAVR